MTPTRHPRHFVPDETEDQLEVVSNTTLALLIRQMSQLVRQAEEMFSELERECQTVDRRSRAVITRMDNIQTNINSLDCLEENLGKRKLKIYALSFNDELRWIGLEVVCSGLMHDSLT